MQPSHTAARWARLGPAAAAFAVLLAFGSLTRLALALRPDVVVGAFPLLRSMVIGLAFDAAAAACMSAPIALLLGCMPNRPARRRTFAIGTVLAFSGAVFTGLLLAVAEWLFWDEFGGRFNFIAVDYLLYTQEVLGNIWQSYPTGRILVLLALLGLAAGVALRRPISAWTAAPLAPRTRLAAIAAALLVPTALVALLDSDQKRLSSQDAVNELAGNGVFEFFAALRRNELDFDRHYATLPLDEAIATARAGFPGAEWVAPAGDGMERRVPAHAAPRRLNVVLVSVESLGAEFLGAYGDTRGLTPNLDRLARESLWFSRAYATGNRTVRGLEALSLALPPTPGQSIVRRPNNEKLFSLGSVFEDKGYAVLFAYGGYGYFDNMNAFFDANDYRVVDRRAIPASRIAFENVWGVADEHLYDQVIDEIDREKAARPGTPVFAHVMTTSNHRPYTYPAGRIDIPPGQGREGAVKYTDYAIGRLIALARTRPWFNDTLFVITADHGANARGSMQIPVDRYRIPVLFYAPAHLAPARIGRLMSQIDIAPTLLGVLNIDYYSKFLGRDLLHSSPDGDRAFVGNFQTVGYLRDDGLVLLQPGRKVTRLRPAGGGRAAPAGAEDALTREAISFYQVAAHLFRDGGYRDEEQREPGDRPAR